jgi:hypothetical protein
MQTYIVGLWKRPPKKVCLYAVTLRAFVFTCTAIKERIQENNQPNDQPSIRKTQKNDKNRLFEISADAISALQMMRHGQNCNEKGY